MKTLIAITLIIAGAMYLTVLINEARYPMAADLKVVDGVIHHPTYGEYPEEIPFEQGMTLMPGQSASGIMVIPIGDILEPTQNPKQSN